jgi:hypothetical protein
MKKTEFASENIHISELGLVCSEDHLALWR